MPLDPLAFASTPAPGRDCGTCTLCCKVYEVPAVEKPAGSWCRHCTPSGGCGIHETRPQHCRSFFCRWMTDGSLPPEWKPERAKMVLTTFPTNGFLYVQVDPGQPLAWKRQPYLAQLQRWAAELNRSGRHVMVFVNDVATLILPTQVVPLGPMRATDTFRLRQRLTASGMVYEAERLAGGARPERLAS